MEEGGWPFSESAPPNRSVPLKFLDLRRLSSIEPEAVGVLKSFVYPKVTGHVCGSKLPSAETLKLAWTSEASTTADSWV